MPRPSLAVLTLLLASAACSASSPTPPPSAPTPAAGSAKADDRLPSLADKARGLRKLDGFFPLYWDERHGQLWLEIPRFDAELLLLSGMATGVGSSEVGLDRGERSDGRVVAFRRLGPKVLLEEVNLKHRSSSANAAERAVATESFPSSVLWAAPVAAEDPDGRVLVDATGLFAGDPHEVARALKEAKQGHFELDAGRSALSIAGTRNFPSNTEVEAVLTFVDKDPDADKHEPGAAISAASPTPTVVTVRERTSLVRLPDAAYRPRAYDPRSGFFDVSFEDYEAPVGEPLEQRLVCRHRLRKKDPSAAVSEPVEPIVYYLDPGVPEPLRAAILEGARWWADAFVAAGFRDAFRVEMLPAGADPMDVRYNVIEWVHRASRGWSYGATIVDPRTGEILKGHVVLGSKRARQDFLIFQGLLAPYRQGQPADPRLMNMVLARFRQLAAHEVGHTLGLRHNFAASVANRASVMDYPAPRVSLRPDGAFETDDAYAKGVGGWDVAAIRWGYSEVPAGADEPRALSAMLDATAASGLPYVTDGDAWAPGSACPLGSQWDDGRDPVAQLADVMRVRARALERFGEDNLPPGAPHAELEDVLVPLFLYHRYQLEAVARVVGGQRYGYSVRGGRVPLPEVIPPDEQRRALGAVLATLSPDVLALPERILTLLAPQPPGYGRTRESFAGHTGPTFDPLAGAQTAAQITLGLLLDPERAARLLSAPARQPRQANPLALAEVIDRVFQVTWRAPAPPPTKAPVKAVVDDAALAAVVALATSAAAAPEVRAQAYGKLQELREWLDAQARRAPTAAERAHLLFAAAQIRKLDVAPAELLKPSEPARVPPGAPIGGAWEGRDE